MFIVCDLYMWLELLITHKIPPLEIGLLKGLKAGIVSVPGDRSKYATLRGRRPEGSVAFTNSFIRHGVGSSIGFYNGSYSIG